jgi:hypothetical protein
MGVANVKDITAKADRAETSEGIFRMKEGYGYVMGLMGRKEEQRTRIRSLYLSINQNPPHHQPTGKLSCFIARQQHKKVRFHICILFTAAGKSPGDRTYDLRKFSTITDMLQGEKIRRAGLSR